MKALRDACVDYFSSLTLYLTNQLFQCKPTWKSHINKFFVLPVHAIFLNSRSPWVFLEQKTRNNVSSRVLSFAVICIFLSPHVNGSENG